MDQGLVEFVVGADVVIVSVRRDGDYPFAEEILCRVNEAGDAHAGVDDQISMCTAHVPDVAAHQLHYVRFPDQRDVVVRLSSLEPTVNHR